MGNVLPRVPMRRWGVGDDDFGGIAVFSRRLKESTRCREPECKLSRRLAQDMKSRRGVATWPSV